MKNYENVQRAKRICIINVCKLYSQRIRRRINNIRRYIRTLNKQTHKSVHKYPWIFCIEAGNTQRKKKLCSEIIGAREHCNIIPPYKICISFYIFTYSEIPYDTRIVRIKPELIVV